MYEYKVNEIKKVYDGDTITVSIDLGMGVSRVEKIRLADINAPEVRGDEREAGLVSRDWLKARLADAEAAGTDIIIRTIRDKKGKYGRYIGKIYIDNIYVNQEMIDVGMAIRY